jgi:hypothetical protein
LATLFDGPPGVTEEGIHLSDFTTDNVSTSKHGFAPKLPNDAAKYLDGTGNYTVPAGTGTGSVTSISAGTGITLTPNPITTTGSVAVADTAITPATYGDSTHVGQFTVDQQGRLTAASNVAIASSAMSVSDEGSLLTATPSSMNFVGAGVTATAVADAVTVTIPGASSGDISPFSDDSITKPAAADFTIADDTTAGHGTGSKANLATRGVELTFTAGANATSQSLFFEAAVSSTLNTMIAYIAPNFGGQNGSNQYFYGLAVRDNAGKIDSYGISFDAGVGNTVWKHATFTNISTAPTISAFNGGHMACGRPIWLKLAKVSTNFVFSVSSNGETYDVVATLSATGFIGSTINDVGIVLYDAMSNGSKIVNLDVFSFTKS